MKTAVSIPDDVFAEGEEYVRRAKVSRSELYATALREYLARHDPDVVTAELNRVLGEAQAEPDPGVLGAAIAALRRAEW
ncbi:MAG: hypothetical protein U0893_10345 [Chloroflexota bacterium]